MDILDHPKAQQLLDDAELSAAAVQSCIERLVGFAQRYLPRFYREEQRGHALTLLQGKLTGLQRKTTEPIANQANQKRRPLQLFVGNGQWEDQRVLGELRQHVAEELGDPEGVFIFDGSSFAKKGSQSCGVARQWCGSLGKVDNCQVGVFLAYAAPRGKALIDAQLYLTEDWAADRKRRDKTFVPPHIAFAEKWRIGLALLDRAREVVPGQWVVGDDEFGRCTQLRAALRQRRYQYVLHVPCDTLVRDPAERRPPKQAGGRRRLPEFERVDRWVARQPAGRWRSLTVRDGENGPLRVQVLLASVQTKDEGGVVGPQERLVVLRTVEKNPQTTYALSNARAAKRAVLAKVNGERHRVEELFQEGKGEVGLDEYEVRSWVGWHHHMTLSLLALWFLQLERLRLGEKNTGDYGGAGACRVHRTAEKAKSDGCGNSQSDQQSLAA